MGENATMGNMMDVKCRWKIWVRILLAGMILMAGCGKKEIPQPPVRVPETQPADRLPEVPEVKSTALLLKERGNAHADKEQWRSALKAYDLALGHAGPDERPLILEQVFRVLSRADAALIRSQMEISSNRIPEEMLLYALGYRYAARGNAELARQALKTYLARYPDGAHAPDARELLSIVTAPESEGVTIGCMLPLSGRYAVYGQRALKGVQTALERLSRQYGDKITLVIRDTASDSTAAVRAIQELIDRRVTAVAGPMVTAPAVAQMAQEAGVPLIAMTQRDQVASTGDYIFCNFITPAMQVEALVSHAVHHRRISRFGVLYPLDRYGRHLKDLFLDKVQAMGGEISAAVAYDTGKTDFGSEIRSVAGFDDSALQARLKQARRSGQPEMVSEAEEKPIVDFQALFIPDGPKRLSLILPQLIYNDVMEVTLLGTNIWHDPSLVSLAGDYVRQAVITDGFFAASRRVPAADAFTKAFQNMHGNLPGFIEAVAYDTVSILVDTAMIPGVNSPDQIRRALAGQHVFEGATGNTFFDTTGRVRKDLFYITVQDGRFRELFR